MSKDHRNIASYPYHYSLIHQSPGIPGSGLQPPLYHLDIDNQRSGPHTGGGLVATDGVQGTKVTAKENQEQGNDSLVTEQLLLKLTECDSLSEIRVISLRNQQLTGCLKILSHCDNLTIAYLQGNFLQERDL